jgi:lipopolysaccharide exporter
MLWGSVWAIGLRWAVRLSGFISTIIVARLIAPADYGIVAIASLIVGMIEVFNETGVFAALVRHPNPTREHFDSAWTTELLLAIGLAIIIWMTLPVTVQYFHEPRVGPVVAVFGLRTAMVGLVNIGIVNFRRNLQFRKQFIYNICPTLVSVPVTIVGAFMLRNYWALVIGIMTRQVVVVTLSYVMEPFRPHIGFSKVREIWSFSIWTLFNSVGRYVNVQIDKLAIGAFAGAAGMGRYEVARDVAVSPIEEVITPMSAILLPVMAKLQDDKGARRELYLYVLYWSALICSATSVGVALVAQDMADLVLGPKWSDVGVLIPWFALAAGILGLSSSVYSAYDTIGQPAKGARLQWIRVLALASVIIPTAYFSQSIASVAIARLMVTIAVAPTLFYALSRTLEISLWDFAAQIWRPILASVFMAIAVLAINHGIQFSGSSRLLIDVAVGASVYGLSLMLFWHFVGRPDGPEAEAWHVVRRFVGAT